jgi:copper(I)-binding protein
VFPRSILLENSFREVRQAIQPDKGGVVDAFAATPVQDCPMIRSTCRFSLAGIATATAAPAPAPTIVVDHGWFTTLPNHGPTYGYFRVTNKGGDARMMTGYRSPACGSIKLEEAHGGGTNSKAPVQMTVAPNNRLAFVRGGYHLVCAQPTDAIAVGRTVPVTIEFQDGKSLDTSFEVRAYPYH